MLCYYFLFFLAVKTNSKGTLRLVLLSSSNLSCPKGKGQQSSIFCSHRLLVLFASYTFVNELLHVVYYLQLFKIFA